MDEVKLAKLLSRKLMITEEELYRRVEEVKKEYYGMINNLAALCIIALENGIDIRKEREGISVRDLGPRMRNVSVEGVIVRKYQPKKVKEDVEVQSFILSDGDSEIRVVVWSKTLINTLSRIPEFSRVRVMGGYTKEGRQGLELHLGSDGKIILLERGYGVGRLYIKDMSPGDRGYIVGIVRSVFPPKKYSGGVVNAFLVDDGTDVIKCVIFGEEKVKKEDIWKEYTFVGRCRENSVTGKKEFIVEEVFPFDPKKEIEISIFS